MTAGAWIQMAGAWVRLAGALVQLAGVWVRVGALCLCGMGCAPHPAPASAPPTSPSPPSPAPPSPAPPSPAPPSPAPPSVCDPALHTVVLYPRAFESPHGLPEAEFPEAPVRWRALVAAARLLPGRYDVSGDPRLEYCMTDADGLWVVYDPRGVRGGPPVEASCGPIGAVDVCFTVQVGE